MRDARKNELISKAVSPGSIHVIGRYTNPRTYGVYRIEHADRRFRFGNHPIREKELIREHGNVTLFKLFREREYAKELATLLNV